MTEEEQHLMYFGNAEGTLSGPLPPADQDLPDTWDATICAIRDGGFIGRDMQVAVGALSVARLRAASHPMALLIVGPPGSGKTALARALASQTERMVTHINASTLSPSGWQGETLIERTRATLRTIILDDLDTAVVNHDLTSNSAERVGHLVADIRSLLDGSMLEGVRPPVIGTCTLPTMRPPVDGALGADALVTGGMAPSLANLWGTILYLPPLEAHELARILVERAVLDAAMASVTTGYRVFWSSAALGRLQWAGQGDPSGGLSLGLRIANRALEGALLNAMSMGLRPGGKVLISLDHVAVPSAPRDRTWTDIEGDRYGMR